MGREKGWQRRPKRSLGKVEPFLQILTKENPGIRGIRATSLIIMPELREVNRFQGEFLSLNSGTYKSSMIVGEGGPH